MPLFHLRYLFVIIPFILLITVQSTFAQQSPVSATVSKQREQDKKLVDLQQFNNRFGKNDTIWSMVIVYEGDTIPAKTYTAVDIYGAMTRAMRKRSETMTRLRNAVYVTYPYARKAGIILNDMNAQLAKMNSESQKKDYIKSMEKDLRKQFTDPMERLSVYQGKVLMKLTMSKPKAGRSTHPTALTRQRDT